MHEERNAPSIEPLPLVGGKLVEGRGNVRTRVVQELRGHKREHEDVAQVGAWPVGAQEGLGPNSAVVRPTEVEVFRAGDAGVDNLDWTTADGDLVTELCHRRVHKRYFGRGGAVFRAGIEVQPRQVFFVTILGICKDGGAALDEDPKLLLRHIWN
eukprot:scaffold127_cov230-Pinguiococcus_pyrenoidosus.AAC.2